MDMELARSRLKTERLRVEELLEAANRLTDGAREAAERELSSAEQHPAELATETIERELDNSVLQHAELELTEIDAAVQRVEAGTYGSCEVCGQPISDARLEVMPAARMCIDDQAKLAKSRHNGSR